MLSYQGFYGGIREVARRLYDVPESVVRSTYYALLVQSAVGADIRVFVRAAPGDGLGEVRDWVGDRLDDLPERLLLACWAAPADGAAAEPMIDGFADYTVRTGITCPPTARGAFGHQLRRHEPAPGIRAVVLVAMGTPP